MPPSTRFEQPLRGRGPRGIVQEVVSQDLDEHRAFAFGALADHRGDIHLREALGLFERVESAEPLGKHHGIPLVGMLADLALWTGLRAIQDVLRSLTQLVDDTAGQAESEAWRPAEAARPPPSSRVDLGIRRPVR